MVRYYCQVCKEVSGEVLWFSYDEAKEKGFTCETCGTLLTKVVGRGNVPLSEAVEWEEIGEVESESKLGFGRYKLFRIKKGEESEIVCTCPGFLRKGTCKHIRQYQESVS